MFRLQTILFALIWRVFDELVVIFFWNGWLLCYSHSPFALIISRKIFGRERFKVKDYCNTYNLFFNIWSNWRRIRCHSFRRRTANSLFLRHSLLCPANGKSEFCGLMVNERTEDSNTVYHIDFALWRYNGAIGALERCAWKPKRTSWDRFGGECVWKPSSFLQQLFCCISETYDNWRFWQMHNEWSHKFVLIGLRLLFVFRFWCY